MNTYPIRHAFRAWDPETQTLIYSTLAGDRRVYPHPTGVGCFELTRESTDGKTKYYMVSHPTWIPLACTGLLDSHGTPIYEGDKVLIEIKSAAVGDRNARGTVVYVPGRGFGFSLTAARQGQLWVGNNDIAEPLFPCDLETGHIPDGRVTLEGVEICGTATF